MAISRSTPSHLKSLVLLALLSSTGWAETAAPIVAQTPAIALAIAPDAIFQVALDNHAGAPASLAFFVAREAHLYFALSSPAGSRVLQTSSTGIVQTEAAASPDSITAFDVSSPSADSPGSPYILYNRTRLVEFDAQWAVRRTIILPRPILSLAVVGAQPIGVDEEGRLGILSASRARTAITLEAFPAPWFLFAPASDAVGIFRAQASALHVFQVDGEWGNTNNLSLSASAVPAAPEPLAIAAAPDGQIYVLFPPLDSGKQVSVLQCDSHGDPRFQLHLQLPPAFSPRFIGIAPGPSSLSLYLVAANGKVAVFPLEPHPLPALSIDSNPLLLSDTEPLRVAVRNTGYTGPLSFDVDIRADGSLEHAQMQNPLALGTVPAVMDIIQAWRFRPAVRSGVPTAIHMEMNFTFLAREAEPQK